MKKLRNILTINKPSKKTKAFAKDVADCIKVYDRPGDIDNKLRAKIAKIAETFIKNTGP